MKITQLFIYPIKSLRGISLPCASLFPQGLIHDRQYILLRRKSDGSYENMWVGGMPEMALFHCKLSNSNSFTVTYHTSSLITQPSKSHQTSLEIPFEPETRPLAKLNIELHTTSECPAFQMPDNTNSWFSECFGYEVILAYLGNSVGVKLQDGKAASWISVLKPKIVAPTEAINFSDGAAILVVSESSLQDLQHRLGGERIPVERFRPNIVVDGTKPWDEDFWSELTNKSLGVRILLTSNCARCIAINVDLEKGRMAEGESGKLLKTMMRDRRIDPGNKWSPIFGRYGFPTQNAELHLGDELIISTRNKEHTVWNGIMPRLTTFAQTE